MVKVPIDHDMAQDARGRREPRAVSATEQLRRRDRGESAVVARLRSGESIETDRETKRTPPFDSIESASIKDPSIPEEVLRGQAEEFEQRDETPVGELRRKPKSTWRRVLQVGAVVFTLAVCYYFVSLWQVYAVGRSDQARGVDAIVVMGAAQYDGRPSPQLAARLDHVLDLWQDGVAPTVVVTGGKQPGDRFTEAEASAEYLIEGGIPESALLLENAGSTSFESLDRVAAMLLAGGSGDDRPSVLVVTDPYHSLRSRLIAQEAGLTAYVSPTDTSVVTGARSLERHLWEAGGVSIGRITSFDWLDDVTD